MKNIKNLYEYLEKYGRFTFRSSLINESKFIFSDNVLKKVCGIEGQNCLVINDVNLANELSKGNRNKVLCIYTNKLDKIPSISKCTYAYSGDITIINNKISNETKENLQKIINDFVKINGIFDFIFNITLNSDGNRFNFEVLSEFNRFILLELGAFDENKTIYYSFDDKDVTHKFDSIIHKNKYSLRTIKIFRKDDWNAFGFNSDCDINMNIVSVPKGDSVSTENLDETDNIGVSFEDNSDIIKGVVEPKIYAFRTKIIDNILPDGVTALKVGDTNRGVDIRMDEWNDCYPGLFHDKDWEWSAVISGCGEGLDGKIFRDKSIHKILVNDFGIENVKKDEIPEGIYRSNEFFKNCKPDDVTKAISKLKELVRNGKPSIIAKLRDDKRKDSYSLALPIHNINLPYKERDLQTQTIDKFEERFIDGDKEMLMYAVMRFGKTYTACRCAQELKGRFTVIVSAKADVRDEWVNQVNPYKEFEGFDMYVSKGTNSLYEMIRKNKCETLDEYLESHPDKHVMLFLTLQDLSRYVNKAKRELKYYQCFINTIVDLLIIDEAHYGAQGKSYGKGIGEGVDIIDDDESVSDSDTKKYIDTLHFDDKTVKLHLSGTPYDLVARGKFNDDSIISHFGFEDLVKAKRDWEIENADKIKNGEITLDKNPYYGIPEMISFGYSFSDFSLNAIKAEGSINFANLFKIDEETDRFVYEDDILNMFQKIDGKERDSNVLDLLNLPEIKKGNMCKHIVIVLPHKDVCDVMEKFLDEHSDDFINLKKYKVINIAGNKNNLKTTDAKKYIREEDRFGNKTISLTVKQMLTGVSVPQWDTMFYMKDGMSAQEYDQARFRIQTPNIKNVPIFDINDDCTGVNVSYDDDGNIVKQKVDMKPQTIFVDFAAERIYNMLFQKYSAELKDCDPDKLMEHIEELVRRDSDILPIVINNMGKLKKIEFENLMKQIQENFCNDVFYGKKNIFDIIDDDLDTSLLSNENICDLINDILSTSSTFWRSKTGSKKNKKGSLTKPPEGLKDELDIEKELSAIKKDDPEDSDLLEDSDFIEDSDFPEYSEHPKDIDDDSDMRYVEDSDIDIEADENSENKLKVLLRNIFMYILCKNDDTKITDFHRLWDSMRVNYKKGGHPENWRLILKLFDEKNEKKINWHRVFDNKDRVVDCDDTRFAIKCVREKKEMLIRLFLSIKKASPSYYLVLTKSIAHTAKEFGNRDDFNNIKEQLEVYGRNALGGSSEIITPEKIMKPLTENFVISNSSNILDCYGSKIGEILYYLSNNFEDFNIDNYYLICKNNLIAELNKVTFKIILKNIGKKFISNRSKENWIENHILVYDYERKKTVGGSTSVYDYSDDDFKVIYDEKTGEYLRVIESRTPKKKKEDKSYLIGLETEIIRKWGDMKFDVVVGNPPYGVKKAGTNMIHMKIMKTILSFIKDGGMLNFIMPAKCVYDVNMKNERELLRNNGCVNVNVLDDTNEIFSTEMSVKVGIYEIIKGSKEYDSKLDDSYADSIYNETEKKFMRYMESDSAMFDKFKTTPRNKERTEERMNDFIGSLDKDYYFNINFASGVFNKKYLVPGNWVSRKLLDKGILSKEDEIDFVINDKACKRVFGFDREDEEYAKNLFDSLQRPLLRFGLWLSQDDQNMNSKVYKYFPDIDYSKVKSDEDILLSVGCKDENDRNEILDYVNHFNFDEKRNDRFSK